MKFINNIIRNVYILTLYAISPIILSLYSDKVEHIFTYDFSHNYIFMMLIIMSFYIFKNKEITKKDLYIGITLQYIIGLFGIYKEISSYIINDSILNKLFLKLPGGSGTDLMSALLIIIIFLLLIINIIYDKIKNNVYYINKIFYALGLGAIILTTTLFHTVQVEMGYKYYEYIEKDYIENFIKNADEKQFLEICSINKYDCYLSKEDTIKNHIEIKNVIIDIPDEYQKSTYIGNFGNKKPNDSRYKLGIFKYENKWLIETKKFEFYWNNASESFFLLCDAAHIFWALFMIYLMSSHQKRKSKKLLNGNY